ncbi:MAG: dihydroorotate dehydrogenase [Actinomycetota bacterium]
MTPDLAIDLAGVRLASPVLTASGCFGSGQEMSRFVDLGALGAVVCKTVTLKPRQGIAPPRGAETPSGMLNAIGLQNPGVDAFIAKDLAWLDKRNVPAIASIGGHTVEEYVACAERLRDAPMVALELNLSCPNLEDRGFMFALAPEKAAEVCAAVKQVSMVPVFAKLSPDVTDLVSIADAAVKAGADGLSLINTTLGMAIDVRTFRPKLSTGTGGLSGPAIRPVAVRCIWQVHSAMPHVPIIGMGGVAAGEHAIELVLAGATAVAVGTANFYDPRAAAKVRDGIAAYLEERGFSGLEQIRGQVKVEG